MQVHDSQLVQRATRGDRVALTLLLAQSRNDLIRWIQSKLPSDLRSRVDGEDIVQETQVAVFQNINTFQPDGDDAFGRWLRTIALRRLRNAIRQRRAAKRGGWQLEDLQQSAVALLDRIATTDSTASQGAARREGAAAVQIALQALPDHYRQAVELVYLREVPVAEAAAELGRTERAVHNLCRRARLYLQEVLGTRSQFLSAR